MNRPALLKHAGILTNWRDYPAGSVERAKALGLEVLFTFQRLDTTRKLWESKKQVVDHERPWVTLGLTSREAFIEAVTGHGESEADEHISKSEAVLVRRAAHPDETQQQTADAVGCSQQFVARVLTTKNFPGKKKVVTPDWLRSPKSQALFRKLSPADQARVWAHEAPLSVIAREAGLVHKTTPLEQLHHWWARSTRAEQEQFLGAIRRPPTRPSHREKGYRGDTGYVMKMGAR